MDKVRIGVVGLGNIGKQHARHVREGRGGPCELTAVCDKKAELLDLFGDVEKFTDSEEMMRSGKVDAVIIATPHYFHTDVGIQAFENNIHVLVEKPISVHKSDCEKLIAARKNKDLVFSAMFQMRLNPHFQKLKKLLDAGELGRIMRVNWINTVWFRSDAYYAMSDWRATWKGEGGGVLMNQCPHNLDIFQWLFGLPDRVRSFCHFGKHHEIEVEDEVTAYCEYPNGATGVFVASTGEYPGTDRLEVAGERGKIVYENGKLTFARNEVSVTEYCRTTEELFGSPEFWNVDIPVKPAQIRHDIIIQNFVDAILGKAPLIVSGDEGIGSVELANAITYSTWTNDTVELPLDGAAYEAALKKRIKESTFEKKVVGRSVDVMNKSFKH